MSAPPLDADDLRARLGASGALATLRALGVDTDAGRRSGDNLTGLRLPPALGPDENPSLSVDLDRWLCHDFGGHFDGTLYQLVEVARGLAFLEAVRFVAEANGYAPNGHTSNGHASNGHAAGPKPEPTPRERFRREPWKHGREAGRFTYREVDGRDVMQVRRWHATDPALASPPEGGEGGEGGDGTSPGKPDKAFLQYRPDPDVEDGGWLPGLKGVEPVPYRLPELAEAVRADAAAGRDGVLVVVEGERHADALAGLAGADGRGLAATTNPGGAKSWRPTFAERLVGMGFRRVYVLPDADADGVTWALGVARSFAALGATVLLADPFGRPGSGRDVLDALADWQAAGREPLADLGAHLRRATAFDGTPPGWAAAYLGPPSARAAGRRGGEGDAAGDGQAGTPPEPPEDGEPGAAEDTGEPPHRAPQRAAEPAVGPPLPRDLFEPGGLHDDIRRVCDLLGDRRAADVFVTGLLPVMSSAQPNVRTKYGKRWKALNLSSAVVAPASGGKGALGFARDCAAVLDKRLRAAAAAARQAWLALDKEERATTPEPPEGGLFLSANSSVRGIEDDLGDRDGRGLLVESEIKTITTALKQDWGDFTSLMLKNAENEPIDRKRKGEPRFYHPGTSFAVAVSGTLGAFSDWIRSAEDGLFSRVLFYAFDAPATFDDQFGDDDDDELDGALARIGRVLDSLHAALSARPPGDDGRAVPLVLRLSPAARAAVNDAMGARMQDVNLAGRADLVPTVRRGGLAAVRVAGVLAAYRLHASGEVDFGTAASYTPDGADVRAAVALVGCFLDHATALSGRFGQRGHLDTEQRRTFFAALPERFTTAEAIETGRTVDVTRPTVERLLKALSEDGGLLVRERHGQYRKAPAVRPRPVRTRPPSAVRGEGFEGSEGSEGFTGANPSKPSTPSTPSHPQSPRASAAAKPDDAQDLADDLDALLADDGTDPF